MFMDTLLTFIIIDYQLDIRNVDKLGIDIKNIICAQRLTDT